MERRKKRQGGEREKGETKVETRMERREKGEMEKIKVKLGDICCRNGR